MPSKLKIKILFCYSPEVLKDTYNNFNQLDSDNYDFCHITEGIFKTNVTTYNVKTKYVCSLQVDKLQVQNNIQHDCLTLLQLRNLAACMSPNLRHIGSYFGTLPQYLLDLKAKAHATVLVLEVKLCDSAPIPECIAFAPTVGASIPEELVVVIGRKIVCKGQATSSISPHMLAHEFGHLMGCRHPKGSTTRHGFDDFNDSSHGHCIVNFRGKIEVGTIMSYANDPILYYSNPNIYKYQYPYQNVACGVVGESEAYKIVNANIKKLTGIFK